MSKEQTIINFYSANENPYGVFSNFALYPIKLKQKVWPTSEHFFQAQKFKNTSHKDKIRKAISPMMAAKLGRDRKIKIQKNWDNIKDNIMYEAIKAKFSQHPELKQILLETGNAIIIEHTENDHYWGDGGDGSGKNKLGKLLMKLREELNKTI